MPRLIQATPFNVNDEATGDYLVPFAIGIIIFGPIRGWNGRRWSVKWPFVAGLALIGIASVLFALADGARALLITWMFVAGSGFAASIGAAGTFITESVEASMTGVATTFNSVMRLIGGGIRSELGAGILEARHGQSGYAISFWIAGGVAIAGAALAMLVPAADHSER